MSDGNISTRNYLYALPHSARDMIHFIFVVSKFISKKGFASLAEPGNSAANWIGGIAIFANSWILHEFYGKCELFVV